MSCLFNSISKLLYNELTVLKIHNLRGFICYYMENNLETNLKNDKLKDWLSAICIDRYNKVDIKRYIREMKQSNTWGGAPEIAIVSKIFKVQIVVNYGGRNIALFDNSDTKSYRRLYLQWTGGHYEPIKIIKLN